jgi:hypothetical protein
LLQKKPVHPVQYALVGIALIIFYTLLISISEFILFNYAYLIAATATVLLITLYAKGHFQSWKTAGLFGAVLTSLYGFIFILIQLEDTALLIGSIGLFIVLALVMYACGLSTALKGRYHVPALIHILNTNQHASKYSYFLKIAGFVPAFYAAYPTYTNYVYDVCHFRPYLWVDSRRIVLHCILADYTATFICNYHLGVVMFNGDHKCIGGF